MTAAYFGATVREFRSVHISVAGGVKVAVAILKIVVDPGPSRTVDAEGDSGNEMLVRRNQGEGLRFKHRKGVVFFIGNIDQGNSDGLRGDADLKSVIGALGIKQRSCVRFKPGYIQPGPGVEEMRSGGSQGQKGVFPIGLIL